MSELRILITGSRDWVDKRAITNALVKTLTEQGGGVERVVVIHGGARGADTLADQAARFLGYEVEIHHADWQRFGKSAGQRRNAEMVAAGANICLAFPLGESRGTRGCMAMAAKAGITVVVPESSAAVN